MEYTVTKSLCNFEFWSGARDFSRRLTTDEFEQIEDFLVSTYDNLSETEINDIFWFESDFLISDVLGLDIDEFWKRD